MNNRISVDGHPDLQRDSLSGAIINNNTTEYENYIKTMKSRVTEKQKIENIESDLTNIKSELNEIKDLLKKITTHL